MSETNFPWESAAGEAPRAVRARARRRGPGDDGGSARACSSASTGSPGSTARRAWRAARVRAHVLHHHETALWRARPEGRFVAIDEPEPHDPIEARAEMLARYLAAFGPASRRDIVAWSMMHVPEIQRALDAPRAAAPLPRRAGPRAPRRPARAAAGSRYARARPLPAEVGQRPARVRGPDARAPRGVPQDGDRHERRRRADVPRRRVRRGHVARRERSRRRSSRSARSHAPLRRELEDEAERLEAFLAG